MQLTIIAGNVGKDSELRNTQSGESVLGFSVAVSNGKDKSGQDRPTTWWNCSLWGTRAEKLAPYIKKGMKLTAQGRPSARSHEGKAYLELTVSDLTFMGSAGEKRDQGQSDQGYGSNAGGRPGGDMDDEIPFEMEWRL